VNHTDQQAASIGIIGGADGPTSVFLGGQKRNIPFRVRLRNQICQYKRRKAEKKITAGSHTLEELIAYAQTTYNAVEADGKPNEIPAASRVYEIKAGDSCLEIEIDDARNTFGVSYSGSKKVWKQLKAIARDLYVYYGVSEDDIRSKTERYFALLGVLCV